MIALKIKTKFTLLSLAVVIVVIFATYFSYVAMHKIETGANEVITASTVLSTHQHADMMHDAIRGDVMQAALGLAERDAAKIGDAKAQAEKHTQAFADDIEENLKRQLSPDVRKVLTELAPKLENYRQAGMGVIGAVEVDLRDGSAASKTLMHGFEESFSEMEEAQETVSGKIEAWMEAARQQQLKNTSHANIISISAAALTVLIVFIIPLFAKFSLFDRLSAQIETMHTLTSGKLDVTIDHSNRQDELGEIAKALIFFRKNAGDKIRMEKDQELQKKQAEETRQRAMQQLASGFETKVKGIVDTLASAATEMDATSRHVMSRTKKDDGQLGNLVQGVGTASQNIQTLASSATQLSASIREIGGQVARASKIASQAVEGAGRATETAASLKDAADRIGSILTVINDITGQINLLALNATIEAARAGDAGKGFAVVAGEVKTLAGQTASATQQIEQQINLIQSSVGNTVSAITDIGSIINEMSKISSAIAAAVEEQGVATQEIARNVTETAEIAEAISGDANGVRASSSETSTAVGQMISATQELSQQAETLRVQVAGFLEGVRKAA